MNGHGTSFRNAEIQMISDFLGEEECSRLVRLIAEQTTASLTFEAMPDPDFRTSTTCWMDHAEPEIDRLYQRLCEVVGAHRAHGERMQGQRYLAGQRYKPHHDFIRTDRPSWHEQRKLGGQRTFTAMVYLNDVGGGGETRFPQRDLVIEPRRGLLVWWNNLDANGLPDNSTLHEGCPVVRGEKFIITQWFREKPCRLPGWKARVRRVAGRISAVGARIRNPNK